MEENKIKWQALKICVEEGFVSTAHIQKVLKKGYAIVAEAIDELVEDGYLSELKTVGSERKREILISKEEFYRKWEEKFGK